MLLAYEEMTAKRLQELCDAHVVLLLSFGSVEQHSTHLPVGTDFICTEERVKRIAEKTGCVYFSPIKIGYSFHHKGMMGTISFSGDMFSSLVRSLLEQLFQQGWMRIIVFSGHQGNWPAIQLAVQGARERFQKAAVVLANGHPAMSGAHRKTRFFKNFDFHAGAVETSIVSCFRDELIDKENFPDPNEGIPPLLQSLLEKNPMDEIDETLVASIIPQHTNLVSNHGMWGRTDPRDYKKIPADMAMQQYIDFYVRLIQRWNQVIA